MIDDTALHKLACAIQLQAAKDYYTALTALLRYKHNPTLARRLRKEARALYDYMGSEHWTLLSDVDGTVVRRAVARQARTHKHPARLRRSSSTRCDPRNHDNHKQ